MNPEQQRKQNNDLLKRLGKEIDRVHQHFDKMNGRQNAIEKEMSAVKTNIKWLIRLVIAIPSIVTVVAIIYEVFLK